MYTPLTHTPINIEYLIDSTEPDILTGVLGYVSWLAHPL